MSEPTQTVADHKKGATQAPPQAAPTRSSPLADVFGALRALQQTAGNAGVQRLLQPQARSAAQTRLIRDLTTKCIDRDYPKPLDDKDIQLGITELKAHLARPDLSDGEVKAAADNLQVLEAEVAFRLRNKTMDDHLTDIVTAPDETTRRQKTDNLIAYTRDQLMSGSFPAMVDTFVRQTRPDANEKVRVLGKVVVEAERMEFFLGNIYHKGAGSWEVNAAGKSTPNQGHMVDTYTGGTAMQWCSRFATTALARVRGSFSAQVSSGYQIANPGEFAGKDLDYGTAQGGGFVGMHHGNKATAATNPWAALRKRLTTINSDTTVTDKPKARQEAVEDVFTNNLRPQPGDLMIVTEPGANPNSFDQGHSHTTTIEQISGYTISTIEGNASDRVTGHQYDLTDATTVGKIVFIARPSLASGRDAAKEAQIGAGVPTGTATVGEQQLLEPLLQINAKLEEFAALAKYIKTPPQGGGHTVRELD